MNKFYTPNVSSENVKDVMDDFKTYLNVQEKAAPELCQTPLYEEIGMTEELFYAGIEAARTFIKSYMDYWKKEVCLTCDDEILRDGADIKA